MRRDARKLLSWGACFSRLKCSYLYSKIISSDQHAGLGNMSSADFADAGVLYSAEQCSVRILAVWTARVAPLWSAVISVALQFEEMYEQKRKEVNKVAEKFEKQLKAAKKSGSKANTDKVRAQLPPWPQRSPQKLVFMSATSMKRQQVWQMPTTLPANYFRLL